MKALKMTLILVFCFGIVRLSFGQPDTLWTKTFNGLDYFGTAVLQTENGDFIIGGEGWWSPVGNYPFLFCLDSDGNEKWFKTWINDTTINDQFISVLPEIFEIDSNNFLMGCGGYCTGIVNYNHLLDSTHVVIYDTSYGWDLAYMIVHPIKFQKVHDNEFIIVWNQVYPMGYNACITKVNQSGDSLWSNKKEWFLYIDVSPTDDNGWVFLYNGLILSKTNGVGDYTWTKSYGDITKNFNGKCIQQTEEGGFIVLTDIFDEPNSIRKGSYLLRTDEFGDTLWTKKIGLTAEEDLNKMKSTPDGGFIIVGSTTETGYGTGDMLVIKVDKLGNIQWRKTLSGNEDDYASDVGITKDGGYIIIGNRGTVVRLASDITFLSGSGLYEVEDYILSQNYPNPFNPSTTIEFSLPKSEFVDLKVFNILGKEVSTIVSKNKNQGNHTYTFDGKNLASGVYYYQLVAGDYREVKKMILLR